MQSRCLILGVPLDPVTRSEAVQVLGSFLAKEGLQHHVMTPNPEMLVYAMRDRAFLDILRRTALNLPDGAGLLFAAKWLGQRIPERVTGTDILQDLCALPSFGPVFFLGAAPGIAERAAAMLLSRNPSLQLAGTASLSPRPEDEERAIALINASGARVLFVAFGAPAQDLWIDRVLFRLPRIRLAMGVGGAFDFLAEVQRRAPVFIRHVHLEWAWRLCRDPRRLPRILRATIVFPWLVLCSRFGRGAFLA